MASDKLRVYFTVDTETSMGGAWQNPAYAPLPLDGPVFGKIGNRFYGIPLMMDILEEYDFRATFFTEVFCAYIVGHAEVEKVFQQIRSRGHDAQLHLHPTYRFYRDFLQGGPRREIDLMFTLPFAEQQELIGEGVKLFSELNGRPPKAYRAGCYGASEVTLRALRENGVIIDSSYNLAAFERCFGFETPLLNAPKLIEGVYEFPTTVFRTPGWPGYKGSEIHAVSVAELLQTIRYMRDAGCRDVVLGLHSFSLLKNLGRRYEDFRPDRIVIQRLRNLCSRLSQLRDEVDVQVLGEVELESIPLSQPQFIPSMGWARPVLRNLLQAANRLPWL